MGDSGSRGDPGCAAKYTGVGVSFSRENGEELLHIFTCLFLNLLLREWWKQLICKNEEMMRIFFISSLQIAFLRWAIKKKPNFEFCLDIYFKHYDLATWIYNWKRDMECLKGIYSDHKGT